MGVVAATVLLAAGSAGASTVAAGSPVFGIAGVDSLFEWITRSVLDGMVTLLRATLLGLTNAAEPEFDAPWFLAQMELMLRIGLLLTVPVAIAATISSFLTGGLNGLLRTWLIGVPCAVLGGVVSLGVVAIAQSIDDNLTNYVLDAGQKSIEEFHGAMVALAGVALVTPAGLGTALLMGLLMLLGLLFFYFELIFRQILLNMSVLFLPLGFALATWSVMRRWIYNMIEITLVLVFAKFVMTATLVFGLQAVLGSFAADSAGAVGAERMSLLAAGTVIVFVAVFVMPVLISFVFAPNLQVQGRQGLSEAGPWNQGKVAGRQGAKNIGKLLLGKK